MNHVENFIRETNIPSLTETPELIDILNTTEYDKTGLTLEEIKEYLLKNSRLSKRQIKELFSINKFNSDPTMRYKR